MATKSPGGVLQSWVSPSFAAEVRELADQDGRSVSGLIKLALRERLEAFQETDFAKSVPGEADDAPASGDSFTRSRSGAGTEETARMVARAARDRSFEVSIVAASMNADTRFVELKRTAGGLESDSSDLDAMSLNELRACSKAVIADIDAKIRRPIQIAT